MAVMLRMTSIAALARINLCYLWRHRRLPDLTNAPRFTEMVQWRKLHDRDPRLPAMMDKLAAKATAAAVLGREWITPTLWSGDALPDDPPFGFPTVIKARHGCNQYRMVRTLPSRAQWAGLQALAARWMRAPYGFWLDEWAYRDTPRGIIAEPAIGGDKLPVDYKIYVFGGRATHVQVHLDRAKHHRWILHDRDFRPLIATDDHPAPPRSLAAMLAAAEALSQGQDFIRVDFYEIDGRPRFGEFCLYPGSGLDPFAEDWIDFKLGTLWHDAAGTPLCGAQDSIDFSPTRAHLAAIEAR